MNPAILYKMPSDIKVKDMSGHSMNRMRLAMPNGYSLSVIHGEYSYGGEYGLYEIAPFNLEDDMDGSLLDEEDQGDDVLGYLSVEGVQYYINKIYNLPKEEACP